MSVTYERAREAFRIANGELTQLKRERRNKRQSFDDLDPLQEKVDQLRERLPQLKAAARSSVEVPEEISGLGDTALRGQIIDLQARAAATRAELKLLLEERRRRELVISMRRKLEKLTPAERAALQSVQPAPIESDESVDGPG